jgi:hypothetical protein
MGVYEARGALTKAMKDLMMRWNETKSDWNDAASARFEKEFLDGVEQDLRSTLSAMDQMAVLLQQARHDCE